jgi:hypothetical protein
MQKTLKSPPTFKYEFSVSHKIHGSITLQKKRFISVNLRCLLFLTMHDVNNLQIRLYLCFND